MYCFLLGYLINQYLNKPTSKPVAFWLTNNCKFLPRLHTFVVEVQVHALLHFKPVNFILLSTLRAAKAWGKK